MNDGLVDVPTDSFGMGLRIRKGARMYIGPERGFVERKRSIQFLLWAAQHL